MLPEIISEVKLFIANHRSLVIGGIISGIVLFFIIYEMICMLIALVINAIDKETARTFAEKTLIFAEELRPYREKLGRKVDGFLFGALEDASVRLLPNSSSRSSGSSSFFGYLGGVVNTALFGVCLLLNIIFSFASKSSVDSFWARISGITYLKSILANLSGLSFLDHLLYAAYFGIVLVILRYVFLALASFCWRGWNYPQNISAAAPATIALIEFLPVGLLLMRILMLPGKLMLNHSIFSAAINVIHKEGYSKIAVSAVFFLLLCFILLYFASNGVRAFMPVVLLPLAVSIAAFFYPVSFLKVPMTLLGIVLFVFIVFRQLILSSAEN